MPLLTIFDTFYEALAHGEHDLGSDQLAIMLTNTVPIPTTDVDTSDISEITPQNGYPAGGPDITTLVSGQTGGVYSLGLDDETITASGGSFGPFRYVVVYNTTNNLLIGFSDYGSSITITSGNIFKTNFSATGALVIS